MRDEHVKHSIKPIQKSAVRAGVTYVELLLVILILAIASTLVAPRMMATLQRQQVAAAALRLVADLNMARNAAMRSSTPHEVVFSVTDNVYQLPNVPDLDRPNSIYRVALDKHGYGASLASVRFGEDGDVDLAYNIYGIPDSGGTIVLRVGQHQRRVNIDASTGRASIDDPQKDALE